MWIDQQKADRLWPWGITLLRVVVGLAFFMHGQQKLFQMGVGNVAGFFGSLGIPAPDLAAWIVSLVETFGGLALILGLGVRVVGVLLAADMLVAMLVFHRPNGFFISDGGIELVLVLGGAALALAMTGPGALALDSILPYGKQTPSGSGARTASARS